MRYIFEQDSTLWTPLNENARNALEKTLEEFNIRDEDDLTEPMENKITSLLAQNKVTVRTNNKFYENVTGDFTFTTNNGQRRIIIDANFSTSPQTEYVVGKYLIERGDEVDSTRIGNLNQINNYRFALSPLMVVYNDQLKYLNTERKFSMWKVTLPDTGKRVAMSNRDYKRIYRSMILRAQIYLDLSKYVTKPYEVKNSCLEDLIRLQKIPKINNYMNNYMEVNDIEHLTIENAEEIAQDMNFTFIVKDIDDVIILEYKPENSICELCIMIYKDHAYWIDSDQNCKPKKDEIVVYNYSDDGFKCVNQEKRNEELADYNDDVLIDVRNILDEIEEMTRTRIMVTSSFLFDKLVEQISTTNYLIDYSYDHCYYKNNLIILNPSYNKVKLIMADLKKFSGTESVSKHLAMDKILNLRGTINDHSLNILTNIQKIRNFQIIKNEEHTIQIDETNSYPSKLFSIDKFPIPTIDTHFEPFNKTIDERGLYYCVLKSYDRILGKQDDYYFYDEIMQLIAEKRVKKILYQYVPTETVNIKVDGNKLNDYEFNMSDLRTYIGWLRKTDNQEQKKYNNLEEKEKEVHLAKYGDQSRYFNGEVTVTRNMIRSTTGIFINLYIVSMTNLSVYKKNKEMIKMNPSIFLNQVRTDSLSYLCTEEPKLPELKKQRGYFKLAYKNENYKEITKNEEEYIITTKENKKSESKFKIDKSKVVKETKTTYKIEPYKVIQQKNKPEVQKSKLNKILMSSNENKFEDLVNKGKSFQIQGRPGYGKSYLVNNYILPYFKNKGLKYYCTSSTKENAKINTASVEKYDKINIDNKLETEYTTINFILKEMSKIELEDHFNKIDFILIDEASQLKQSIYKILEYIKYNTKCSIILIGDGNQCKGTDAIDESWIKSKFVNMLCDDNLITLKSHASIRYTKELDELLNEIEKLPKDALYKLKKLIFDRLQHTDNYETERHLAYYNKTKDAIILKNKNCQTIHKNQGDTIEEEYTIHDLNYLTKELIYTAVSRGRSLEQIKLFVTVRDKKKYETI